MLPLNGVRVIEWSTAIAGPYGGMIFADLGAEVIKVEGLDGEDDRKISNSASGIIIHGRNRAKYIAINTRTDGGKDVLHHLIRSADIFYENRLPGTAEAVGCSYEELSKINPRLIMASIKGYQKGPYGHRPGNDPQTETDSGFITTQGVKDPNRPPVRVGTPTIDETTAEWVVLGSMIALMNREKTGKGEHIVASLYEDCISIMGHYVVLDALYKRDLERAGSGTGAARFYQTWPENITGRTLSNQRIRRWVYIDAASDERWDKFCKAFGVSDENRNKYATKEAREHNPEEVEKIMADVIAKVNVSEFMKKLNDAGLSGYGAPVSTDAEVLLDPHLNATKTFASLDTEPEVTRRWYRGTAVGVMLPLRSDYYNPSLKGWGGGPIRKVGEDTVDVLRELGYTEEQIEELRKSNAIYQAEGME